jgi:ATP-dependent RNA helicase HelY
MTTASPADRYAATVGLRAGDGPELSSFRGLYDFAFDDFQVRACRALAGGHGVLVAAPTGSGKTVAEFAVHLALAQGGKCFYTTPIKALSNQKYADLTGATARPAWAAHRRQQHQRRRAGGGDDHRGAAQHALRRVDHAGRLSHVVLDEVHYLADRMRGAV